MAAMRGQDSSIDNPLTNITSTNITTCIKMPDDVSGDIVSKEIPLKDFPSFIQNMQWSGVPGDGKQGKQSKDITLLGEDANFVQNELSHMTTYKMVSPINVTHAAISHIPGLKLDISLTFQSKSHTGDRAHQYHQITRKIRLNEDGTRRVTATCQIDTTCLATEIDEFGPRERWFDGDFSAECPNLRSARPTRLEKCAKFENAIVNLVCLSNSGMPCAQDRIAIAFDYIYTTLLFANLDYCKVFTIILEVCKGTKLVEKVRNDLGHMLLVFGDYAEILAKYKIQGVERIFFQYSERLLTAQRFLETYILLPPHTSTKNGSMLDIMRASAFIHQNVCQHNFSSECMLAAGLVLHFLQVIVEDALSTLRKYHHNPRDKNDLTYLYKFRILWTENFKSSYILENMIKDGNKLAMELENSSMDRSLFVRHLWFILNEVLQCVDISECMFKSISECSENCDLFGFYMHPSGNSFPIRCVAIKEITFFISEFFEHQGIAIRLENEDLDLEDMQSFAHVTSFATFEESRTTFYNLSDYMMSDGKEPLKKCRAMDEPRHFPELFDPEDENKPAAKSADKRKQEKLRQKERKREAIAEKEREEKMQQEEREKYLREEKAREAVKLNKKKQKKAAQVKAIIEQVDPHPLLPTASVMIKVDEPKEEEKVQKKEEEKVQKKEEASPITASPAKKKEEEKVQKKEEASPITASPAKKKVHSGLGGLFINLDENDNMPLSAAKTVAHPENLSDDQDFVLVTDKRKNKESKNKGHPRGHHHHLANPKFVNKHLRNIIFHHLSKYVYRDNITSKDKAAMNAIIRIQTKEYTKSVMTGQCLPDNFPQHIHAFVRKIPLEFISWQEAPTKAMGPEAPSISISGDICSLDIYSALSSKAPSSCVSFSSNEEEADESEASVFKFLFADAGVNVTECTFCLDKMATHCIPECGHAVYCTQCASENSYREFCPVCMCRNRTQGVHSIRISEAKSRGINIYYI